MPEEKILIQAWVDARHLDRIKTMAIEGHRTTAGEIRLAIENHVKVKKGDKK